MAELFPVKKLEVFKSQNPENGSFDVAFEIDGKLIYAHKNVLELASTTFKRIFSTSQINNEKSIKIEKYLFDDFFNFLLFIYSGKCEFDEDNIFTILDISEDYGVQTLQAECDKYLSEMEYANEEIVEYFYELSEHYATLPLFKKTLLPEIKEKRIKLVKSKSDNGEVDGYPNDDNIGKEEFLFKTIYEWAEHKALKKQEESYEDDVMNFNINDAIKTEISELMPYIHFGKMDLTFLHRYVVKRGFLFAYDELSEMLDAAHSRISEFKVRVTNLRGQSICGSLPTNSEIIDIIKSLKDIPSEIVDTGIRWKADGKMPSTPNPVSKRDGKEWYLVYFSNGNIGVEHCSKIKNESYFLIAEMIPEFSEFVATDKCKIQIV